MRNDVSTVDRALALAPDEARQLVGPTASALILAAADLLQTLAAGRDASHARAEVVARREALDDTVAHLGDESETHHLEVAEAVTTMGLVFALRNLSGNLGDLADRMIEAQPGDIAE